MAKHGTTILLADDDEDDVFLFKEVLADLGGDYEITTAADGLECMRLLKDGLSPAFVFLDINMPMRSGLECLQEIRNDDKLKQLTVIVLSTASDARVIKQAYGLGANLYIRKCNDYTEFKSSLVFALKEH